jgi:hypothetical protein
MPRGRHGKPLALHEKTRVLSRAVRNSFEIDLEVGGRATFSMQRQRMTSEYKGRWFALLVVATIALGACERDPASMRALIADQQQQWMRDLAAVRQRESGLSERTALLTRVRASRPEVLSAAAVRVQPLLNGTRQALGTVETQARQVPARLEPALRAGGQGAIEAIDTTRAEFDGHFRMMREQLDAAERELAALEAS